MNKANLDPSGPHDFVRDCSRVLGLEPDHVRFRPSDDGSGHAGVTWKSHIQGLGSQSVRSAYVRQFGAPPSWLDGCHPHHQHLLLQTALAWKRALPSDRPEAVAPPAGRERDYQVQGPSSAMSSPVPRWPAAASLAEALPQLAERPGFRGLVEKTFGAERATRMFEMMQGGRFVGDDGNELHDFLAEGILNDSVPVWTGESPSRGPDGEDELWPIEVQEFHGVFRVWSPEHDTVGPFLSLDDACSFVWANWPEARKGDSAQGGDAGRGE
jgi:hypothetical protein